MLHHTSLYLRLSHSSTTSQMSKTQKQIIYLLQVARCQDNVQDSHLTGIVFWKAPAIETRTHNKDLAGLKHGFSSLLNVKEDDELFYDREKIRRLNLVEPMYVCSSCLQKLKLIDPHCYVSIGLHILCRYIGLLFFLSLSSLHRSPCTIWIWSETHVQYDLTTCNLYDTIWQLSFWMISISEPQILQYSVLGELQSLSTLSVVPRTLLGDA